MSDIDDATNLYRHTLRPQWGLAIMADEASDKRRYQFEDGHLRTFKKGFYQLLETVDRPFDETMRITTKLEADLHVAVARRDAESERTTRRPVVPFDEQIKFFHGIYPGGFQDEAFLKEVRGEGLDRTLKRHRNPVLAKAQKLLCQENLDELSSAGALGSLAGELVELLASTDMARKQDIEPLRLLEGANSERFGKALYDLLSLDLADVNPARPFDAVAKAVRAGGGEPTWGMLTSITGLARPQHHPFVKISVIREQARWMAPRLKIHNVPKGAIWQRIRAMIFMTERQLEQAGLKGNDLIDVTEFIWLTLRPKARKQLLGEVPDADAAAE